MRKVKRVFTSAILCFGLLGSVFVPSNGGVRANEDAIRILIQSDKSSEATLKAEYGVRHDFRDKGFTTDVTPQQLQALKKRKNLHISLVETLHTMEKKEAEKNNGKKPPSSSLRPLPSAQVPWGIEAIYHSSSALEATDGGQGVAVAVLDTGVFADHPDLTRRVVKAQCVDFTQRKSPIIIGSCSDGNGHGTHVAGTILADGGSDGKGIYGVAPDASLWAYKVLSNNGFGYADDIALAIRYAADQGKGEKLIISMSLGSSTKSTLIEAAVHYAMENGALVIAAAGNSGSAPDTIGYPAALEPAIAVAALENKQENGSYRIADFSSRGATAGDYLIQEREVEVSAPGAAVESTWKDGGYHTISGTSMATPHISGLAAKIWAEHASRNAVGIREELQNRAKGNDIAGGHHSGTGDDIASGFGFPRVW